VVLFGLGLWLGGGVVGGLLSLVEGERVLVLFWWGGAFGGAQGGRRGRVGGVWLYLGGVCWGVGGGVECGVVVVGGVRVWVGWFGRER